MGVTPLLYAARVQEVDSIAALVQRGATVDFETKGGSTAGASTPQLLSSTFAVFVNYIH